MATSRLQAVLRSQRALLHRQSQSHSWACTCTRTHISRTFATSTTSSHTSHNNRHLPSTLPTATALLSAGAMLSLANVHIFTSRESSFTHAESPSPNILDFTEESETGVRFTNHLQKQQLAGVGVRLMGGLVRVYALGVYFNPIQIRNTMKIYTGRSDEMLRNDNKFWTHLCDMPEKDVTLRLVVVREVAGTHMNAGFRRGLINVIGKTKGNVKDDVLKFAKMFDRLGKMKTGSDVRICIKSQIVTLYVDNREIGSVRSALLGNALLHMFVGEHSVAPTVKDDVAKGLAGILESPLLPTTEEDVRSL